MAHEGQSSFNYTNIGTGSLGVHQESNSDSRERIFDAIGGIETHVHLAASFYPPFEIDRWIGEMKGASSHEFGKSLQWEKGYGVVSFGTKDLDWVVAYVRNQKEHHRVGSIQERLERISND